MKLDYKFNSEYRDNYQIITIDNGCISPTIYKFKNTPEAQKSLSKMLIDPSYIIYILINASTHQVYNGQSRNGVNRCFSHPDKPWSDGYLITVKDRLYLDYIENKIKHHLDMGDYEVMTINVNNYDIDTSDQELANKYYINPLEQFISYDFADIFRFDTVELKQQEEQLTEKVNEVKSEANKACAAYEENKKLFSDIIKAAGLSYTLKDTTGREQGSCTSLDLRTADGKPLHGIYLYITSQVFRVLTTIKKDSQKYLEMINTDLSKYNYNTFDNPDIKNTRIGYAFNYVNKSDLLKPEMLKQIKEAINDLVSLY